MSTVPYQNIGHLYDKVPYPQMALLTKSQFESALRQRGMSLFPRGLQYLMDRKVIRPIKEDLQLFHPCQIWLARKFFSATSINLTPQFSYAGFDWDLAYQNLMRQWENLKTAVEGFHQRKDVVEFLRILPILFLVESYYLPVVRGPRPGVISFAGHDYEGWMEWRKQVA